MSHVYHRTEGDIDKGVTALCIFQDCGQQGVLCSSWCWLHCCWLGCVLRCWMCTHTSRAKVSDCLVCSCNRTKAQEAAVSAVFNLFFLRFLNVFVSAFILVYVYCLSMQQFIKILFFFLYLYLQYRVTFPFV